MKIVCDNCATKYSIADDKVRGKVFKIRCKKCSHIIVVRGSESAATAADAPPGGAEAGKYDQKETKVFDYSGAEGEAAAAAGVAPTGDGAVWHLVIDREQVGPMTADEVRQRYARGEVDAETYAWREGFGDWLKVSAIPDFGDLASSASGPASSDPSYAGEADATTRADSASLFAASAASEAPSDENLFASAPPTTAESNPFIAPRASAQVADSYGGVAASSHGGGGGLFEASAPSRAGGGGGGLFESAAPEAPSANDASRMTGQRNENSVLFSLSNLQALAVSPASAPAPAARPGYATSGQSEGSGLIDIRAMAASTLGVPALTSSGSGASSAGDDELPAFGASSFSPVAAQVLLPVQQQGMPKWVWGLFAGGGVLLIVVVIMVVMIVRRPQNIVVAPSGPAVQQPTPGGGTQLAAAVPGAKTDDKKTAAVAPTEAPKGPTPGDDKVDDKKGHSDKKGASSSKHHSSKPAGGASPAAAQAPAETPAAAAPTRKKPAGPKAGGDALDDLLSGATGGKDLSSPKGGGDSPAPKHSSPSADDPNLPDQLKLGDIQRGMSSVRSRVSQCYAQFNVPGTVNVTVAISPSGHVQSVQVTGKFASTPTGDCVAKATKGASFPRFKGSAMTGIEYPWMLAK